MVRTTPWDREALSALPEHDWASPRVGPLKRCAKVPPATFGPLALMLSIVLPAS